MNIIAFNFSWMGFNTFLAFIPLILGWLFFLTKNKPFKYLYLVLWLLFVPNTIYLITDLVHLIRQWGVVTNISRITLVFQYFVLTTVGLLTFILSIYPVEKYIEEKIWKERSWKIIIILNFLIGFGITLGRVERVNSWYVVSKPIGVIESAANILSVPATIVLALLFGLLANFIYFLFRSFLIKHLNIYLSQAGLEKL